MDDRKSRGTVEELTVKESKCSTPTIVQQPSSSSIVEAQQNSIHPTAFNDSTEAHCQINSGSPTPTENPSARSSKQKKVREEIDVSSEKVRGESKVKKCVKVKE
ncbi:unnamed protein product [Phyllotreta striolata]|uniref:Uncharacterized protein n=1 Tax=Phyllotreta striolata TaxID=444603 RepID=A0A9N9TZB1_PHYSR|nr:unnamed protein product [Phyllotreta striolata]